ncbi:hypothetical protein V8E36_001636 [Tilletia maclaganii]
MCDEEEEARAANLHSDGDSESSKLSSEENSDGDVQLRDQNHEGGPNVLTATGRNGSAGVGRRVQSPRASKKTTVETDEETDDPKAAAQRRTEEERAAAAAAGRALKNSIHATGTAAAHSPAQQDPGSDEAIAATMQAMKDTDKAQATYAQERTREYAELMAKMEKMRSKGYMSADELALNLAACRLAHRHSDARGFAPEISPALIASLDKYDIRNSEKRSSTAPAGSDKPAAMSYSSAAAKAQQGIRAGEAPPQNTSTAKSPYAHLKDKHIVGQGKGSAERAAMARGRKSDRLFARGGKKGDSFTLMNQLNAALAAAGTPHYVRVDVVTECPTGLAIAPKHSCTAQQLYEHKEVIATALGAHKVEMDEQWVAWVLPDVQTHAGIGPIDNEFLTERFKEVFSGTFRGEAKRLCRNDEDWTAKMSTPVIFHTSVHANLRPGLEIRYLGRIFRLRRYQLRPSTIMCGGCGSYKHKTAQCDSQERCRRCSRYGHNEADHQANCQQCASGEPCVPLCMHCRGPHSAGDRSCKNRPMWDTSARAYVLSGPEFSERGAPAKMARSKLVQGEEQMGGRGPATGANAQPVSAANGQSTTRTSI